MAYICSTCQDDSMEPDDHPKVHYGNDRYHYDCLPAKVKKDILGDGSTEQQKNLLQIINAAKHGSHGDNLRKKILAIWGVKNG